ncbi:MAG: YihY family inner membrane protein [Actinomycetota bacterium]|nr:YihY family inner membrane protein [Actinomycetota bacterium]
MSGRTDESPVPSQTADEGRPTSPAELGPPGLKVSLQRAVKEFKTDRGSLIAAGMAFYWFLAVFPAIIAAVGVLGIVNTGPDTIADIQKAIGTTLPGEAARTLQGIVKGASDKSGSGSLLATIFGLALAVWGASAGMVALQRGLDVAYDVEEERKLVSARVRAMLLIAFTIVLGGVATVLIVFGAPLGHGIEGHLPFGETEFNILWTVARWILGLAALSILFASYYSLGPNRETPRWTWVSPGGIVATVVWLLASLAFSLYVTSVGDLVMKYGSLSGVVALLLWLYLSALAVILGGELNAELERQGEIERRERGGGRRRRRDTPAPLNTASPSESPAPPEASSRKKEKTAPEPAPSSAETSATSPPSRQSAWLSYGQEPWPDDEQP